LRSLQIFQSDVTLGTQQNRLPQRRRNGAYSVTAALEGFMRVVAALALSLALAGCFSSEHPLFAESRGQCPFTTPTAIEEVDKDASPSETPERYTFIASGGYCQTMDHTGRVSHALFVPIGDQWWIVQDDDEHPSYGLIHREGARVLEYLPKCEEFPADRLRRLGVTFNEQQTECTANDPRQIDTLFRSWRDSGHHEPGGELRIVPEASR
jgi:hypothetical protein